MEGGPMTSSSILRRLGAATLACATMAAVAAAPASAATTTTPVDTSSCATQPASQVFLPFGDQDWYFLAPGGDFANPETVSAAGWELSGGAAIVTPTQTDGSTGSVLDLPSKAKAVSPPMCITNLYPRARMRVRNVVGGEGVQFYVSYAGTSSWATPKNTGQVHGGAMKWQLATPINLQPSGAGGWQIVRFTYVAGGTKSRFQIDDVWVDPRMR